MASRASRFLDLAALTVIFILTGIVLVAIRTPHESSIYTIWFWVALGVLAISGGYLSFRIEKWLPDSNLPGEGTLSTHRSQISLVRRISGFSLLGISVLLVGFVAFKLWPNYQQWDGTLIPWLIAIVLVIIGSILIRQTGSNSPGSCSAKDPLTLGTFVISHRMEIIAFGVIACLALAVRTYDINRIPPGIWSDETNSGLDALAILGGNHASPFATGWYGTPNGFIYYMALLINWFGAHFYTLKLISILPSFMTVLAIYPLGRYMFGPLGGLTAMSFLAFNRWHMTMSRWGWNEATVPLFLILAFYFLIRGLHERRAILFALGGLTSGLMVYIYLSSRLGLISLLLFAIYWVLIDQGGLVKSIRRNWKGLLIFFIASFVVVSPILVTYIKDPPTFSSRVDELSIFNEIEQAHSLAPLIGNLVDHARFFFANGDLNGRHNLPGEAELDPIAGIFFVIGLSYGLFRLRDWRRGMLWLWFLAGLAGGIFSMSLESPQSYRTLTVVPAIALIAGDILSRYACGISEISLPLVGNNIHSFINQNFRKIPAGILLCCISASALWNINIYFGPQAKDVSVITAFGTYDTRETQIILSGLGAGKSIYVSPDVYSSSIIRFLLWGWQMDHGGKADLKNPPIHIIHPAIDFPIASDGKDAIIILGFDYPGLNKYILSYYPDADVHLIIGVDNNPEYTLAEVPGWEMASVEGLTVQFSYLDGKVVESSVANIEDTEMGNGLTSVEWRGYLRIEKSGDYEFMSSPDAVIAVDGKPWDGKQWLYTGLHHIEVVQHGSFQIHFLNWSGPDFIETAVPPELLFRHGVLNQGLTAYFYGNASWEGNPIFSQVVAFIGTTWPDFEPISGQFSVEYKGTLTAPTSGNYNFLARADDGVRLLIDDSVVGEALTPSQPNNFSSTIYLEAGKHKIEVDYFQSGGANGVFLYWQPPQENLLLIPAEVLTPEPAFILLGYP